MPSASVRAKPSSRVPRWPSAADRSPSATSRAMMTGMRLSLEPGSIVPARAVKRDHPDVRFGWGYCEVAFTTHAAGGITRNDLICAARLDALLAM